MSTSPAPVFRSLLVAALALSACTTMPVASVHPPGSRLASAGKGAPAAGTATTAPQQQFTGQVLDLSGAPAAGVQVTAYALVSNNGGSLISDRGGSIVSNNAGSYRLMAAGAAVTDAQGHFTLTSPDGQAFNIEAVQATSVKAFAPAVAASATGLVMHLAHTGVLSGSVTAPGSQATDLTGISVFVPGTAYVAMTDHNGAFTFANMPAGTFDLVAAKTGLGSAQTSGLVVKSDQTTTASLQLQLTVPTITAVTPAAGGPGTPVTITGTNFGAKDGVPFTVSFGGAQAANPQRLSDTSIRAVVPSGAGSGELVVSADQVNSAPFAFAVPQHIALEALLPDLVVGRSVRFKAVATDASGSVIKDLALTWAASASAASVDASGTVKALSAGNVTLSASSGSVTGKLALTIAATPYVATLVGGGQAPNNGTYLEGQGTAAVFDQPDSLLGLPDGSWLVSDSGNNCVRKVSPLGATSLFAGTPGGTGGYADGASGTARLSDPTGLALLPDGRVLVSDTGNHCLRAIAPDGTVSTFAGKAGSAGFADGAAADARFDGPMGLAVDASGTVYVADARNDLIRRIANGTVSTIAGTPPATGTQPVGGFADGAAASAQFNDPQDVLVGPDGTVYVADTANCRIRTLRGGVVATLAGSAASGAGSYGNWGYADGAGTQAHFAAPTHLALDAAGNLFVADEENFLIREVSPAGVVSTVAGTPNSSLCCLYQGQLRDGPAAQALFDLPAGLRFDASGNLYLLDGGTLRAIAMAPSP